MMFFFFFFFVFFMLFFKSFHLLSFLIGLEFMSLMLLLFLLSLFFITECSYVVFTFLSFSVCESVLGLVLFVLFSRGYGKDYLHSLGFLKF